MNERVYRVFISSTFLDLQEARAKVANMVLQTGNMPLGMEWFNAGNDDQLTVIKALIDVCDYYVIVIAHRYGSLTAEGLSYTELEYQYACEKQIPILRFIIDETADWPTEQRETGENLSKLNRFKEKLTLNKIVKFWKTPDELAAHFVTSLTETKTRHPRPGLVPYYDVPSAKVLKEIARLSAENAKLRNDLEASQPTVRDVAEAIIMASQITGNVTSNEPSGPQLPYTMADIFYFVSPLLLQGATDSELADVLTDKFSSMTKQHVTIKAHVALEFVSTLYTLQLVDVRERNDSNLALWALTDIGLRAARMRDVYVTGKEAFLRILGHRLDENPSAKGEGT